ncbi:MAG: T9SS type A sorting domain-containing protein [Bacteroidetes bacterium]|nr:T9SS type A sorting domain-containing protein [Bacteroidota bacterium]
MTSYTWAVSAGGTITAGGTATSNTATITWNTAGAQTVSVNYTNGNSCTAASPTVYNVTVNPLPVPTITGPPAACVNTSGHVYTTEAGMSNYLWIVSAGGSITAGGTTTSNTVTITWNTVGAQTITVNYTNGNGCTAAIPTVFNETVDPLPVPTIAGPNNICSVSTGNVYSTEAGMTGYLWTISGGGSITAGLGTNSVTVTWSVSGAQTLSVNYTNGNGCTALSPTVYNVTVTPTPAPTISGPTPVCATSTGNVYTTQAGMTNYIWTVSAGGTITAGGTTGSNTATVTWNTAGAQTVSVNYTNGICTAASPTVYPVTVNVLPVPTITGPAAACVNSTGNVYTTQAGMTSYVWAVSAGGTITAGGTATSNTATITWNTAGAQTITVNYTDGNGCTATAPTVFNETVDPLPVPTITGPNNICSVSTGNIYSTEAGMTGYLWTISGGGSITAGLGTNSITVTWSGSGAQSVSVNYTNGNGCTALLPTVYNVTVTPTPAPTIAGPTPVCATSTGNVYTTQAGMTNYIWAISAGGTITAGGTSTSNSVTVTWNTPGAQTVSVNYTNGICTAATPTVYPVTVNALPVPTISGPAAACVNSTGNVYTTQAGMTNYTWAISAGGTITAGGTSTSNTVTVTWNTAGAQSVSVNYTNGNGCTATLPTVYNVTVNLLPVPTIAGPTPVCATSTGNVYTTQAGMTNYIWAISAGGSITAGGTTTSNTITITWNTAGAQTVSVNYSNGNGCTAALPTVYNVTVNPLPVPTLAGPTPVCATSTGNVYTTQAGMTNYIWAISAGGTITSGGTSTSNTVTVTWNTAGAQTVSVNYTNGNGCTATLPTVYNVTVNPLPLPTIAGPTPVCATSTGNVYSTQAGMSGYLWTVSAGGSITSGAGTSAITVTWNTAGAQTVSVNYTNGNGCTATLPTVYNVTVNPLPVPTIAGPTPVCAASSGNIYTTQAGMSGYLWTVSAGGSITAGAGTSAITVTWNTAGAQTVSVNYTNGNGCTATLPTVFNVTVNALPVPTITGPTPVCAASAGNVYTTEAGMSGYLWTVSAGGSITAGSGTNAITVTWNTAGAQTVSVNYTNGNGCTALAPVVKNVTVNALPVPTIAGPTPVCVTSTGNVYTTQAGMTNYLWTVSAGGSITAGGTTASNTVTITWNTAGAQTVSVNYTNTNGCTALAPTVYNVTVNPLPVPTIAGPNPVCVTSAGNVYTTQAGMTGYIWAVSAGGSVTSGGTGTSNTVTITWNTVGAQTVSVNYTNGNGCTAAAPSVYNVTVNALPVPTITGPTPVCVLSTGNVYTTQAGMSGYLWNVTGGTITAGSGTSAITVTWNIAGAQTVSVNYTNGNGCTAAAPTVFNVTVTPTVGTPTPITVSAGVEPVCQLTNGTTTTTYATTATNSTGFNWSLSNGAAGVISATTGVMTWANGFSGTVDIRVTANGCNGPSAMVTRTVVVTPTVGTPTPISVSAGVEPTCQLINGTTTTTYSTTATNNTGFNWSLSNGAAGVIGAATGIMTWANGFAGTVNIQVTANGCNGPSSMVIRTVIVTPTVGTPVFALGATSTRCQGAGTVTYSASATNNTGITYTLDAASLAAGVTINGATGVVTYTAGWVGVSMITATATGCNGPSTAFHLATTNPRPGPTLTGPALVCAGSAGNVYTTEAGMSAYTWVVSAGGSITAGGTGTSNTVTVTWLTAGARTVSVNYTNGFGCPALAPTVFNVTVNPLPVPTIAGPTPVCVGSAGNVYTTQTGMSAYVWTVSAGGSITSGAGTSAITVTWNTPGAQTVSVTYTNANGCVAAAPTVFNVTVNALPVPTITGQTNMCVNSGYYLYTTEAGMTSYVWTVSSGGLINFGSGTNQIQVSWIGAGAQTVSVTYSNGVGCNAAQPTVLNVTVNDVPGQAGTITGTANVCAGTSNVAYSVATIPNTSTYIWTLPPNATIASGAGTNSITVDYAANATSGNITVYGNNQCGNGGTSPNYAVTVLSQPDPAGTISGSAEVCEGSTGVVYTVASIANATGYDWTVPSGATIASGSNTNSISVNFSVGAVSGVITVAGTNSCGSGVASPDFNVTVNAIPAAPVVTNTGTTLQSSASSGNQWYYSSTQTGAGAPITGATGQTYDATQDGWYWSVVTLSGCSSGESNRVHILTTGIGTHEPATINVYPVPNDGRFTASIRTSSNESINISVYNNLGVKIYEENNVEVNGRLNKMIDLRPAPNGVYTVVFENSLNVVMKRIVINK